MARCGCLPASHLACVKKASSPGFLAATFTHLRSTRTYGSLKHLLMPFFGTHPEVHTAGCAAWVLAWIFLAAMAWRGIIHLPLLGNVRPPFAWLNAARRDPIHLRVLHLCPLSAIQQLSLLFGVGSNEIQGKPPRLLLAAWPAAAVPVVISAPQAADINDGMCFDFNLVSQSAAWRLSV